MRHAPGQARGPGGDEGARPAKCQAPRHGGFVLLDVLTGLAIVGLLAAVLAAGLLSRDRAARRMGEQSRAARLTEQAVTQLQRGQAPNLAEAGARVSVHPVTQPAVGGGMTWAVVRVTVESGTASQLSALIPAPAAPSTAPATQRAEVQQ